MKEMAKRWQKATTEEKRNAVGRSDGMIFRKWLHNKGLYIADLWGKDELIEEFEKYSKKVGLPTTQIENITDSELDVLFAKGYNLAFN